ncbi:MAG: glycosyl transferase [Patescibacteria group bacterium]|nr:MAG: glycosyl transferase [Patescibacteria group bacterium]
MKLSLCLAVYNEEKNIHYPLKSAIDLVDEVVIVDGGSTDKTVEIAKSYGKKVKIINTDNPAMFHNNKQKAIDEARGEWILQLDADEELSEELKKEIIELLQIQKSIRQLADKNQNENSKLKMEEKKNENIVAYWIPRKNWFLTKFLEKGGVYPDYTIRLYKKGVARFPCRDVHENVEIKGKIGYLKNPILHYADPDFSRYLMRWDRYTTLEVQNEKFKIQNEGKNQVLMFFEFIIWKPATTFFSMYFRHLGFLDGFPGFVFALFSSIRFWVIYIKWKSSN